MRGRGPGVAAMHGSAVAHEMRSYGGFAIRESRRRLQVESPAPCHASAEPCPIRTRSPRTCSPSPR